MIRLINLFLEEGKAWNFCTEEKLSSIGNSLQTYRNILFRYIYPIFTPSFSKKFSLFQLKSFFVHKYNNTRKNDEKREEQHDPSIRYEKIRDTMYKEGKKRIDSIRRTIYARHVPYNESL